VRQTYRTYKYDVLADGEYLNVATGRQCVFLQEATDKLIYLCISFSFLKKFCIRNVSNFFIIVTKVHVNKRIIFSDKLNIMCFIKI
jgi:hypothetical protein